MPSLMDMEKKNAIIGGIMCSIVGLFLLVAAPVAVPSASASNNCVDIACLKERLRLVCEADSKPEYLDCQNIFRCIDAGEQEIMRDCAVYSLVENETRICNSADLLYRSWCEYNRGSIPK